MSTLSWLEANQRYLMASLEVLRACLLQCAGQGSAEILKAAQGRQVDTARMLPAASALETLGVLLKLSPFEQDIVLLCLGMELDPEFGALCAAAHDNAARPYPTFHLALSALPNPHWSALTPASPLRRWRLIEVGAADTLRFSPLRLDERILHYLTGINYLDDRLTGLIEPLRPIDEIMPSHGAMVEQIVKLWSDGDVLPIVQLCGLETSTSLAMAVAACERLRLKPYVMRAAPPSSAAEIDALTVLWEREAALSNAALIIFSERTQSSSEPGREAAVHLLLNQLNCPLILVGRERLHIDQRAAVALDVHMPTPAEQHSLWETFLGGTFSGVNGGIDILTSQYDMNAAAIRAVCSEVLATRPADIETAEIALWDTCRARTRPRLDDMAQRIESTAVWSDLVLPEAQCQIIREIAIHVRHRSRVYNTWGFADRLSRGLGISALFAGPSGTGKTMAAEVLANELRLDLHKIDLGAVVSKYIGETEKNLQWIFDEARYGGVILLFDEADALFGKRSEVKDSHDRYANIEVSYLLQRMESFPGLAILTTNMKNALDPAFLRRIRFVVQFPFPDTAHRAAIWQRIFPENTPTYKLDVERLARLNVTGGSIRNIALNAAFLAANADEPLGMAHLLQAARSEAAKLEKPITDAEVGGWLS